MSLLTQQKASGLVKTTLPVMLSSATCQLHEYTQIWVTPSTNTASTETAKATTINTKATGRVWGVTSASVMAQNGRADGKAMARTWLCHESSRNGLLSGQRKRVLYAIRAKVQARPSMVRFIPITSTRKKSTGI